MTEAVIRSLREGDVERICASPGGPSWKSDRLLWRQHLNERTVGIREILVVATEEVVAYGSLAWFPRYRPFLDAGIPEITGLVVCEGMRRRGFGAAIIDGFERRVREAGRRRIGIGVGLHADYGPAQRLYAALGYRPDGNGVTYRCERLKPGARTRVDDDLVLWMTKDLPA